MLNLNDSSKLALLGQVAQPLGLPVPDYTPSHGTLRPATELLKAHGIHTRLIVAEEIADGCRGLVSALGDLDGIETTFGEQFDVDAPRIHHFIVLTG